jgi:hypothetical protein
VKSDYLDHSNPPDPSPKILVPTVVLKGENRGETVSVQTNK